MDKRRLECFTTQELWVMREALRDLLASKDRDSLAHLYLEVNDELHERDELNDTQEANAALYASSELTKEKSAS